MQLFIIQTTSSHVNYLSCFASQLRAAPPTHLCIAVSHIHHTGLTKPMLVISFVLPNEGSIEGFRVEWNLQIIVFCQLVERFHLPFFAWSFSPYFAQALDLAKASC